MVQTKVCTKCGEEKLATAEYFHRSKKSKDGLVSQCKICVGKKVKEWAKNNPEKVKENTRRWNERNPGASANRAKQWRNNNPERYKAVLKKWYEENREDHLKKNRQRYQKNRKKYYLTKLKWNKNNPEKCKEIGRNISQRYKARKKMLSNTFTFAQWNTCKKYFNHSCAYCGKPSKQLHQEHFVPITNGGGYTVNNIIPACKRCNTSKFNHDFFVWYPAQPFYSKFREKRILKYLNYDKFGRQQASILELVREDA